jgi:hypothetical protein
MVEKEEVVDMILNTPIGKISGPEDMWEEHIDVEDEKVLIVGYKAGDNFCEEDMDEECVVIYSWYWELRNFETWDLLQENHDTDLSFCSPSEKEPWGDESTFEEIGDISKSKICTWGEQNRIEDIAEDVAEEVLEWLRES